jgi:hypothetical protein
VVDGSLASRAANAMPSAPVLFIFQLVPIQTGEEWGMTQSAFAK